MSAQGIGERVTELLKIAYFERGGESRDGQLTTAPVWWCRCVNGDAGGVGGGVGAEVLEEFGAAKGFRPGLGLEFDFAVAENGGGGVVGEVDPGVGGQGVVPDVVGQVVDGRTGGMGARRFDMCADDSAVGVVEVIANTLFGVVAGDDEVVVVVAVWVGEEAIPGV